MNLLAFWHKPKAEVSGDLLVADFHSALLNLVTMDAAKAAARRSEADITGALQYNMPGNGVYITPGDISPAAAEVVMKTSVDAHFKKVQAAQITSYTTEQVSQSQLDDIKKYKGRKVRITKLGDTKDVFVPLWADSRTGMRRGTFRGKSVTGMIDDISFEQNALVLTPTFWSRTIQPARKYFLVSIISMETLTPDVKIELV
jgi:hypothetical protein